MSRYVAARPATLPLTSAINRNVARQRKDYLPTALESGKHVLVDYPISTSVSEMVSFFEMAHKRGLHLQESTMFIHHHRVKEFLSRILSQGSLHGIETITASLNLSRAFLDKNVRQSNPNCDTQGCVATLARYCALFGVLVFRRVDIRPVSVHVIKVKKDETGLPTEARCIVHFDKVRWLVHWRIKWCILLS